MSPHLIRAPGSRQLRRHLGERLVLEARVEPEDASVSYRWSVDGRPMRRHAARLEYAPTSPGRHRVEVTALAGRRAIGHEAWLVSVTAPDVPSTRAARSRAVESKEGVSLGRTEPMRPVEAAPPALPVSATSPSLAEADVRRWLEEYARAWSRKDIAALRRMGQFRSAADAARLERYFESVDALHVDVHVLALMIDGPRAVVEFERIDTVTDPSGRHQRLRLPPMRKEIEKSPEGFRFTGRAGHG